MKGSLKGFRAWLETKRPRSVVGVALGRYNPDSPTQTPLCPLGRYQEETGARFSRSSSSTALWPTWTDEFILRVDHGAYPDQRVTAARALRILQGVRRGL